MAEDCNKISLSKNMEILKRLATVFQDCEDLAKEGKELSINTLFQNKIMFKSIP